MKWQVIGRFDVNDRKGASEFCKKEWKCCGKYLLLKEGRTQGDIRVEAGAHKWTTFCSDDAIGTRLDCCQTTLGGSV